MNIINSVRRRRLIIGGVLLYLVLNPVPFVEARDDWEYWNGIEFKAALQKTLDLKLKHELRLQDDFGNFYLTNASVWLLWKPVKFVELGPAYRYEYTETSTGKNTDENRVWFETTLKTSLEKWKFSNRHRFERRDVSGRESFRWRSQVKVSHPLTLGTFEITPFASEEIFYDAKKDEFNQNRVILGVSRSLSKAVTLDLYYLVRSDRTGSDWNEREVIGTEFKISF